jgi:hypothetical protein
MTIELETTGKEDQKIKVAHQGSHSEAVYGLGMIGAWVYYIGRAETVEAGVKGFFKGIVWPAFMVYELLEFLHKE